MPENISLGFKELVAIAIGGMVGGGIFTILGISVSIVGLLIGVIFILFYEFKTQPDQLLFISGLYAVLSIGAWSYTKVQKVV